MHEAPEPVYVDTEQRGSVVQRKAMDAGRDVRRKTATSYDDIRRAVAQALEDSRPLTRQGKPGGTLVFDSASDLQDWAVEAWLRETGNKKVYPRVAWAHVYEKVDRLIDVPRRSGMNIVLLCRAKDEWRDDEKTGRLTFDGYKKFPYKADVGLLFESYEKRTVMFNALEREFERNPADLSWSALFSKKEMNDE